MMPVSIYSRRKEDCFLIDLGHGEKIRELIGKPDENGGAQKHSVAHVLIEYNGYSDPHYHPKAEESYLVQQGKGRLIVDGKTITIQKGDNVLIEIGRIHQIFNDCLEDFVFYCVCAPAWTQDGFIPKIDDNSGLDHTIFVGKSSAGKVRQEVIRSGQHRVANVELGAGQVTEPQASSHEMSYLITEGQGRIYVNDVEKVVRAGDAVLVPAGKVHKIFNDHKDSLAFIEIAAVE